MYKNIIEYKYNGDIKWLDDIQYNHVISSPLFLKSFEYYPL